MVLKAGLDGPPLLGVLVLVQRPLLLRCQLQRHVDYRIHLVQTSLPFLLVKADGIVEGLVSCVSGLQAIAVQSISLPTSIG